MDRRLTDALERHPGLDDWVVRRHRANGAQVYLAGRRLEAVRRVSREVFEVEVFNDHARDGETVRGSATIPVGRDEIGRFPAILDEAVAMARMVDNPPWPLPGPLEHPAVELTDPSVATPDAALPAARDAVDLIRELTDAAPDVRLSAVELFIIAIDEEIANSRGLHGEGTGTQLLLELNLLADGPEGEAEYFRQARARRLVDLHLSDLVRDGAGLARDAARAAIPSTRTGPVVIRDLALEQLLGLGVIGDTGVLLAQCDASTAYAGLSRVAVGEPIHGSRERRGDALSVRSNARRPFGGLAYRFDDDGLPGQDLSVIEDGILVARPATQRYAQYLGIPATGRPGVAEIARGTTPLADLVADPGVISVHAFSSTNVDPLTGNFGMEIRIGYESGPSGTRPVRGGSVTGNLFDALAEARFSAEPGEGYAQAGPLAVRFESLQIAGSG